LPLAPDIEPGNPRHLQRRQSGTDKATPRAFGGYLDDLAVWNGILTQHQIQALADGEVVPTKTGAVVSGNDQIKLQGSASFAKINALKALTLAVDDVTL